MDVILGAKNHSKMAAETETHHIFCSNINHPCSSYHHLSQGTVASAINKTKVRSITTKDDVMKSKPKPSFHHKATVKVNKGVPSRKKSTSNAVRNINRQITEPHSSFPRLCVLLARGRLVSSSSSSSIRKAEAKPSSNSQHSRTKLETKLLIQIPNIQVTRLESSASSSSIRKAESKPSSNSQHSRNKLETRLPVLSRSAKSSSKNIALTDGLRNMAHDRKSSEWSSHHMRPGVEEPADQRPKVFRSLLAREKSNHSIGVEQIRSYNKELKQEEGKDKILAGLRRDAKHASTLLSYTNRASVLKLVHKIVPLESAKLCDRAEERCGISIWLFRSHVLFGTILLMFLNTSSRGGKLVSE